MLITALFTIAKPRNQARCLKADEWIKKIWFIYTMDHYSDINKNECNLGGG
jgi:hypothetical protein